MPTASATSRSRMPGELVSTSSTWAWLVRNVQPRAGAASVTRHLTSSTPAAVILASAGGASAPVSPPRGAVPPQCLDGLLDEEHGRGHAGAQGPLRGRQRPGPEDALQRRDLDDEHLEHEDDQ